MKIKIMKMMIILILKVMKIVAYRVDNYLMKEKEMRRKINKNNHIIWKLKIKPKMYKI